MCIPPKTSCGALSCSTLGRVTFETKRNASCPAWGCMSVDSSVTQSTSQPAGQPADQPASQPTRQSVKLNFRHTVRGAPPAAWSIPPTTGIDSIITMISLRTVKVFACISRASVDLTSCSLLSQTSGEAWDALSLH